MIAYCLNCNALHEFEPLGNDKYKCLTCGSVFREEYPNVEVNDMAKLDKYTPNVNRNEQLTSVISERATTVTIKDVREVTTKFGDKLVATVERKGKLYDWFLNGTSVKKLISMGYSDTNDLIGKKIKVKKVAIVVRGDIKQTLTVA